jgi:hypothetical protein
MANKAQIGGLSVLSIGGITGVTGTETFSVIGDFISLSLDGGSRTVLDVTTMTSTFKEKLGALADYGNGTLMANRLPTASDVGQTALYTAWGGGQAYDFKIILPPNKPAGQVTTGDTALFSAIISSGPKMDFSPDKAIQVEFTVDISGPVTWTAGS